MQFLVPLAGLLGIEIETLTDRLKQAVILNVVMAVLAMIGVSFLLVAGFFALADLVGPVYAGLILAGIFLVLALGVFISIKVAEGQRRRQLVEKRRSSETSALVTSAALTALPVLLKSPLVRTLGLPAAAIAAFLVLRSKDD